MGYEGLSGEAPRKGEDGKPVLRVLATIKLLGKGSYCEAYEKHDWMTGKTFAKILLKKAKYENDPKTSQMVVRMMKVWKVLDNRKGIVPFPIISSEFPEQYVSGNIGTRYFYIMPKYSRTLQDCIKSETTIQHKDVVSKMRNVAEGLMSLKQANVVHMDIKPDNIFVNDDGSLLFFDFNCSYMKEEYVLGIKEGKQFSACNMYWAPEVWLKEGRTSEYSRIEESPCGRDMLAAGLSLLEYATKGLPGIDTSQFVRNLAEKHKAVMYNLCTEIKDVHDREVLDREINDFIDQFSLSVQKSIRTKYAGKEDSKWVQLVQEIFMMIRPDTYFRTTPEELLDIVNNEL